MSLLVTKICLVFLSVGQLVFQVYYLPKLNSKRRNVTDPQHPHLQTDSLKLIPQTCRGFTFLLNLLGSLWSAQQRFANRCSFHLQSLWRESFVSLCR